MYLYKKILISNNHMVFTVLALYLILTIPLQGRKGSIKKKKSGFTCMWQWSIR